MNNTWRRRQKKTWHLLLSAAKMVLINAFLAINSTERMMETKSLRSAHFPAFNYVILLTRYWSPEIF